MNGDGIVSGIVSGLFQPMACALAAIIGLSPVPAIAQEPAPTSAAAPAAPAAPEPSAAPAPSDETGGDAAKLEPVVVTGTLIRGVAPVGSSSISVDREDIRRTGAVNTNQVLATVPVVTNAFNTNTISQTNDPGTTTFRPNIRRFGAAGGNTTLVLVDGHNIVGAGVGQTTPDSGVIPPGMIERIEILPDGGSSLYGADAVGGIINFITRRSFDGVQVDGAYGFTADGYRTDSANITMGRSWSDGAAMMSLLRRSNNALLVKDRKFPRQDLTPYGGSDFRGTNCVTPNITVGSLMGLGGTTYRYEGQQFIEGAAKCDSLLDSSIVPDERQNAAFASLMQKLADRVGFDLTAYYSRRQTQTISPPLVGSNVAIQSSNFYWTPVGDEQSQNASFSYQPVFGNPVTRGELETFGITPAVTFDLANDWQIKAMYNYGWSDTTSITPAINPAEQALAAAGTMAAAALNPYDIAVTDSGVLARLANYEAYGNNKQTLSDVRVIGDGRLFSLPGGTVRLALGAEHQYQTASPLFNNPGPVSLRALAPRQHNSRRVTAGFAQIVVPVVGAANALPLVQRLDLDISVRHDEYSDFGSTTNPRFAFKWHAVDGVVLRGNVGTSFNAPSLVDLGTPDQFQYLPNSVLAFLPGGAGLAGYLRPMVLLAGGNPNLEPQTATTWSTGIDFKPEWISGLKTGVTYWSVDLDHVISVIPPSLLSNPFDPVYQPTYLMVDPSEESLRAIGVANNVTNTEAIVQQTYGSNNPPYLFVDAHIQNGGKLRARGLDFYVNHAAYVGWGTVFSSLNGTYAIEQTNVVHGATTNKAIDNLAVNTSPLQIAATVGTTWNRLTASASVSYSKGYDVTGATNQTRIGSFEPLNLAFVYDLQGGTELTNGLSLSLNVNNVLDDYPPFLNSSSSSGFAAGGGTGNGSTLGRLLTFGVRKVF